MLIRRVVGDSMLPTLKPGQLVVAITRFYRLHVGDIVIIEHDHLEKIKRITHQSHDTITIQGDNAFRSTDSRQFGDIPRSQIMGKVIFPRYTSVEKLSS